MSFVLWLVGLYEHNPPKLSFGTQFKGLYRSLTVSRLAVSFPVGPVKGESSSTGSLPFGFCHTADADKSGPAEAWNAVQISLTPQYNHTFCLRALETIRGRKFCHHLFALMSFQTSTFSFSLEQNR